MASALDITGRVFGRLRVLRKEKNKGRYTQWKCFCSCGTHFLAATNNLRTGNTKSCGCLKIETITALRKIKNRAKTFRTKIARVAPNSCWLWKGSVNNSGYGSFCGIGAHVFAYELAHGPRKNKKLHVLHSCDTPRCCNPKHLFLGTKSDNWNDALNKGRTFFQKHPDKRPRGEKHRNAKLTKAIVKTIRKKYATGKYKQVELAARYGSSQAGISQIIRNTAWRVGKEGTQ